MSRWSLALPLPERTDQIDAAHKPGGSEPKDDSGYDRDGYGKHQYAPVDRYVVYVRQALGNHPQQEFSGEEENRDASNSAKQEEQQALGQKLADETRSLRSQSLANRDLDDPRPLALARSRLATLTQLIKRTNPTAPNSRMRDWRTLPTTLSLSGIRRMVHAVREG